MGLEEGLKYCLENGFSPIIMEPDSLSLINMLNRDWIVPWSVALEVNSINRTRALTTTNVQHTLKEGNTHADYLTNLALNFEATLECKQFQDKILFGSKIINADKNSIPHLRIK